MGVATQREIKAVVFLIQTLATVADSDVADGLFGLLRRWEMDTVHDLSQDGSVEIGRYKLGLTRWYEEDCPGQVGRRRVVVILDSATRTCFALPDYSDWYSYSTDWNSPVEPVASDSPIQTEKATLWDEETSGQFTPYRGLAERLDRIHGGERPGAR